ncbi:hypothetical protein [Sphingomonas sp.]|uniref:hypothetical protein n=1 Tax=Sphingomonas sp. TaxID=28214 RepID=UPI003AFFB1D0
MIDAVLLDINLRCDMAYDPADELRADDIPFAFVTGYDRSVLPDRFARLPAAPKPLGAEQLVALLFSLLRPTEVADAPR